MRITRSGWLYAGVVGVFCTYLYFADYLFNVVLKASDEARLVIMELPKDTENISFFIEQVRITRPQWKDVLSIRGWIFREGVEEDGRDVFLVLKSGTGTRVYDIIKDNIKRRGVTRRNKLPKGVDDHGFEIEIPTYILTEDSYEMGFIIRDQTGEYFSMRGQGPRKAGAELVRADGSSSIQYRRIKPSSR